MLPDVRPARGGVTCRMTIAPFAVLVMIAGLILYLVATMNAKAAEVGRLMFAIGLFWTLYGIAGHVVHVG